MNDIETIKKMVIHGIYSVVLEKHFGKDVFVTLKDKIDCLFENYKNNRKEIGGCAYCKQKTEWSICNADGRADKPREILFCPMCGKELR